MSGAFGAAGKVILQVAAIITQIESSSNKTVAVVLVDVVNRIVVEVVVVDAVVAVVVAVVVVLDAIFVNLSRTIEIFAHR